MAVGELVNHKFNDSVAFGLPLLYNKRLPDCAVRGNFYETKARNSWNNDAFAPELTGLPQPRTQFPLDSLYTLPRTKVRRKVI